MAQSVNQTVKILTFASVGFIIRFLAITTLKEPIRQRVEVTTPISSWKRAYEAVYLWNSGIDPYSGNVFHEYPLSLQFYKILVTYFNVDLAFAAIDVITAILLQQSVYNQLILIGDQTKELASSKSIKVLCAYLFSPISIIACTGTPTSIFTNFLIAAIGFILPLKPFRALTCVLCAFLACNNIHYSTLIVPIFLCLEYCINKTQRPMNGDNTTTKAGLPYYHRVDFKPSMTASVMICLASLVTLISASYLLMGGSWSFIRETYLFALKIKDLTPNIGLFWYLFTEMFEQFLDFFTWVVQINAFVHVIPLSLHLRDNPFFALYIMILISSISQPYPSLTNIGLITSLLPQWWNLIPHMSRRLVITCAAIACMSLWPVFWHLWIMMGTANSNFYFGATLAFSVSLILFAVDILNADGIVKAKLRLDLYKKQNPSKFLPAETIS